MSENSKMPHHLEILQSDDLKPRWNEKVELFVALIETGDPDKREIAIKDLKLMASLANAGALVLGSQHHNEARSLAPSMTLLGAYAIVEALSSWRELLDDQDIRNASGSSAARVYARSDEAKARLDKIFPPKANSR
ncbi:hypothetical protein NO134_21715 [Ochrobactrum sp. BD22]